MLPFGSPQLGVLLQALVSRSSTEKRICAGSAGEHGTPRHLRAGSPCSCASAANSHDYSWLTGCPPAGSELDAAAGAFVLDRVGGVAYLNISERADVGLAEQWVQDLGYRVRSSCFVRLLCKFLGQVAQYTIQSVVHALIECQSPRAATFDGRRQSMQYLRARRRGAGRAVGTGPGLPGAALQLQALSRAQG